MMIHKEHYSGFSKCKIALKLPMKTSYLGIWNGLPTYGDVIHYRTSTIENITSVSDKFSRFETVKNVSPSRVVLTFNGTDKNHRSSFPSQISQQPTFDVVTWQQWIHLENCRTPMENLPHCSRL